MIQIQIITTPESLEELMDNAVEKAFKKYLKQLPVLKNADNERDFRIKEAQDELKVSRATINTLLRTGQLEYYNIGRSVRIPKAAIEKFKVNNK